MNYKSKHCSSFADTIDVQRVVATLSNSINAFTLQCEFITGSDATGCMVVLTSEYSQKARVQYNLNLPVCDQSKSILPHESCMRAQKPAENPAVDLTACNDVNYEVREGVHGVTYHDKTGDQPNWTPVVAKRKKKQVPVSSFVRQRFAPDHPIHQRDATSDSDSDSGSDVDL